MDDSPAKSLVGTQLGEWLVISKNAMGADATGGCFSVTYKVTNQTTRQQAFLKAVDLIDKLGDPDRLRQELNCYHYESQLLDACRGLDGVVRALSGGIHKYKLPIGIEVAVPYIVFEVADGDLRTHKGARLFNLEWRLRVFHGVCVAMRQLHALEIAHQDLKPSNVLLFGDNKAKIADLGRAIRRNDPLSVYNGDGHQGDNNYIPIELLYDQYSAGNWARRRLGADFFMMGCLLVYLVADVSLLTLIFSNLDRRYWPAAWRGTFEEVLPHLHMAFESAVAQATADIPENVRASIIEMIGFFACPDPRRRGSPFLWGDEWENKRDANPAAYLAAQYSLEATISRVDALATKTRLGASLNKTPFLKFFRSPFKRSV